MLSCIGDRLLYLLFGFRCCCSRTLHIDFRSESASGLIFVVGDFMRADMASAYLRNGYLTFARRCASGRAFEVHHRRYDDHKWHTVRWVKCVLIVAYCSIVNSFRGLIYCNGCCNRCNPRMHGAIVADNSCSDGCGDGFVFTQQ